MCCAFTGKTRQLHSTHLTVYDRLWSSLPYLRPMATVVADSLKKYGIDEDGASIHDVIGEFLTISEKNTFYLLVTAIISVPFSQSIYVHIPSIDKGFYGSYMYLSCTYLLNVLIILRSSMFVIRDHYVCTESLNVIGKTLLQLVTVFKCHII